MDEIFGIMPFCKTFFLFVFGLLAFIKCDIGFVTKFKYSMMIYILDNNFYIITLLNILLYMEVDGGKIGLFFSGFIFVTCQL